jgi:hypothetical protein
MEVAVALPRLTDAQRAAALDKAVGVRRARAELKDRLKAGDISLKQVFQDADSDEIVAKMRVSELLQALPGVGKAKAQQMMTDLDIAANRRLRGLGDRQRTRILDMFDSA